MSKNIILFIFVFTFGTMIHTVQAQTPENILSQTSTLQFTPPAIKPNIDTDIFATADQLPQYVGGKEAMDNFISENLEYPTIALKNGIQGQVVVQFIVSRDGSIKNIEVVEPLNPLCDTEAIRIVKLMPNWIPGKEDNQDVNVRISLPITFELSTIILR